MIPIKYTVRNLRVRWVATLMTVLGTGLVVWSSCILFGLVEGLQHSLNVSGDPRDLIVIRKGSTNETNGGFSLKQADEIATLPGIARDEGGAPLVANELVSIPLIERADGTGTNIVVRGVSAASPKLRPDFKVLPGGRYLVPGRNECVVSQPMSRRLKDSGLGRTLRFGERESYRVVGLFTAGGSAAESEVWVDFKDLQRNTQQEGFVSAVQLRAAGKPDLDRLKQTIDTDNRFRLDARRETDYFASQTDSSNFLKVGGTLIAILLTIGAMFSAANTMYAAVSSRTREIGTMRALGFSRFDILASFLGESVLLCLLGGALGLLATLPLSYLSYATNLNFTESTIHFRFGPLVLGVAVAMTLVMGVFGGLFPAIRAVRLDVVRALREV
jgi:putative ABC transport system permease protein